MTLANIKPSITLKRGIESMATIESAIATLEISSKAIILVANMKAILTTPELITEFIQRVLAHPNNNEDSQNGYATQILNAMRKEQLVLNPMSTESFLDVYMLNPLQALTLYFKEHITLHQVERMNEWGVNENDLVAMKQRDINIRFDRATMQFA